ncbi:MAG: hypothetical protein JSS35_06140, partial [Proteobacteria bacterium]|nr:hypothetical protein [Pseudomonadota bacterium]
MIPRLRGLLAVAVSGLAGLAAVSHAQAQAPARGADLPSLVRGLLVGPQDAGQGWDDLDKIRGTKWGQGPVLLAKPTPDGSEMARPGQATIDGRSVQLVAAGARAGVFAIYVRDASRPRE